MKAARCNHWSILSAAKANHILMSQLLKTTNKKSPVIVIIRVARLLKTVPNNHNSLIQVNLFMPYLNMPKSGFTLFQ